MNEIEAVGLEAAQGGVPGPGSMREDRPWLYSLLIAPSAVVANGVIQGGVLAYLLSVQGIGSGPQSRMIFLLGLPTWLYFLWSPITDFFVRRRTWLLVGGLAGRGGDGGLVPSEDPVLESCRVADVAERVLQPTGGVELRRHDGCDAVGAIPAGCGELITRREGWALARWRPGRW